MWLQRMRRLHDAMLEKIFMLYALLIAGGNAEPYFDAIAELEELHTQMSRRIAELERVSAAMVMEELDGKKGGVEKVFAEGAEEHDV